MNKVGVVLINWNGGELTRDCIDSLRAGSVAPAFIVVVDNASKDQSVALLRESYGDSIHIIRNSFNNGFAGGNNQGIEYLLSVGAEYIWLLNNDTLVDVNCLKELLCAITMSQDNRLGAVSSKIFYESERDKVWFSGADRNRYSFAIKHRTEDIKVDLPTSFISGCCIFARAEIFGEFGGFQPGFIAYSEDDEWCLRLNEKGYHFSCIHKSILYHKVSASMKKNTETYNRISDRALYLMNRNHFWVIREYSPHLLFNCLVMVSICLRNLLFQKAEIKRTGVYFRSIRDGLFQKMGFVKLV